MNSPWGAIQTMTEVAPGILQVTTPSHGGFYVTPALVAQMPEHMRETPYSTGGWFEEDCDWSLVAICFPDAFAPEMVQAAKRIIGHIYPEKLK